MLKNYIDDTCIFILSYKRPDRVKTVKSLQKCENFNIPYYIIISDDDPYKSEYERKYAENLLIFNKKEFHKKYDIDMCINDRKLNSATLSRNACYIFAKKLGYTYYIELDDDYSLFSMRLIEDHILSQKKITDFDGMINILINLLEDTKSYAIAITQNGDYIGGIESKPCKRKVLKKAMNFIVCTTKRKYSFNGYLNEDVNGSISAWITGKQNYTVIPFSLNQEDTQQTKGGLTDAYQQGTYIKSMFSIIQFPSCVKLRLMQGGTKKTVKHYRIHHQIIHKYAYPLILSENYKKKAHI